MGTGHHAIPPPPPAGGPLQPRCRAAHSHRHRGAGDSERPVSPHRRPAAGHDPRTRQRTDRNAQPRPARPRGNNLHPRHRRHPHLCRQSGRNPHRTRRASQRQGKLRVLTSRRRHPLGRRHAAGRLRDLLRRQVAHNRPSQSSRLPAQRRSVLGRRRTLSPHASARLEGNGGHRISRLGLSDRRSHAVSRTGWSA